MSKPGLLKRLLCKHEWRFDRNIYGDEINHVGGKRSWWRCHKCGKWRLGDSLHDDSEGGEGMIGGFVRGVRVRDANPADPRELAEVRVTFLTDKRYVAPLLEALADEPFEALLDSQFGDDCPKTGEMGHYWWKGGSE